MLESQKRRFERAIQILRVISEATSSDPQKLPNKYVICRRIGSEFGTEPTLLTAITDQEDAGHIRPVYIDRNARGGNPSKHYDLTFQGFKLLLGGVRELGWNGSGFKKETRFSTLAQRHENMLPEIFTIWPKLQQQGIADIVQDNLISIADEGLPDEFDESMRNGKIWKQDWLKQDKSRKPESYPPVELEESWRHYFVDSVITNIILLQDDDFKRILKVSPEMKRLYLNELRSRKTREMEYLSRIEAEIREIEQS